MTDSERYLDMSGRDITADEWPALLAEHVAAQAARPNTVLVPGTPAAHDPVGSELAAAEQHLAVAAKHQHRPAVAAALAAAHTNLAVAAQLDQVIALLGDLLTATEAIEGGAES